MHLSPLLPPPACPRRAADFHVPAAPLSMRSYREALLRGLAVLGIFATLIGCGCIAKALPSHRTQSASTALAAR